MISFFSPLSRSLWKQEIFPRTLYELASTLICWPIWGLSAIIVSNAERDTIAASAWRKNTGRIACDALFASRTVLKNFSPSRIPSRVRTTSSHMSEASSLERDRTASVLPFNGCFPLR
jgi:hypothetical protein